MSEPKPKTWQDYLPAEERRKYEEERREHLKRLDDETFREIQALVDGLPDKKGEKVSPFYTPNIAKTYPYAEARVAVEETAKEEKVKPSLTMKMMQEAKELSSKGMSEHAISKQIEKSEGWVKGSLLILNKLPPSVHQAIESNQLSRIAALQLLLCPPDKLEKVVEGLVKLYAIEGTKL
jgi:hypothetical protein